MKTKKLFAILVVLAAVFACKDEVMETDGNGNGNEPATEGKGWMALSIQTLNETHTYGLNNPDQEPGTADEIKVDSALIVFFDTNQKYLQTIGLAEPERGKPGQPGGIPGVPFQADSAACYMMLVINPPTTFKTDTWVKGTTTFSQVNDTVAADVKSVTTAGTGFMMTNSKGGLEPSESNGDLKKLTLHPTKFDAQVNPVEINVDRVVAKVRFYSEGVTKPADYSVADVQWFLNVTNKLYFPMSERVKTAYEVSSSKFSPYDKYKLGSYRIDPNYNNSSNAWLSPGYDNNYNYVTNASASVNWLNPCDSTSKPAAPQYCLENTQREEDNVFAYTTHILIKAKFLPKTYVDADGQSVTDQENSEDWMLINGAPHTYSTLLTFIKDELDYKYKQSDPTLVNAPKCELFSDYLTSIGVDPVVLPNKTDQPDTLVNKFKDLQQTVEAKADRASVFGSLVYYAGGFSYYKVALKHNDQKSTDNELGEFGVVRNSVYDVTVTKFNNPGYPTIPDPDPKEPDDPKETWISVSININPWTWYAQEVIL